MLRTCVRSSRLSLYARTQRLTENAPYKGLWLVVKTTTNQPHSVKCRKAALASIHPNPQNGNLGDYLKSGYAFRNLICSPLPNQVPKMITLLHPWQSHRSYHFENFGFTCNTSLPLVKISGSKWPTEKAGRAAGRDSQIFDRQLAKINGPKWPVEGSQGGTPCPVI